MCFGKYDDSELRAAMLSLTNKLDELKESMAVMLLEQRADMQDIQQQINNLWVAVGVDLPDLPTDEDYMPDESAIKKYVHPEYAKMDEGIALFEYVHDDWKVLRRCTGWNDGNPDLNIPPRPIMEAMKVDDPRWMKFEKGMTALCYVKTFKADGGEVYLELCEPTSGMEAKYMRQVGLSSLGK